MGTPEIQISEKHPMLSLVPEVRAQSESIRHKFHLSMFVVTRVYDDGSFLILTDHAQWLNHHLASTYLIPAPISIHQKEQMVYCPVPTTGPFSQAKYDLRNLFGSYDSLDIACKHENYTDVFCISLGRDEPEGAHSLYLRNQAVFDGFMQDFLENFKTNFKKASNYRIPLPRSRSGLRLKADTVCTSSYVLPRFTDQEKTCLDQLLAGHGAKEISAILGISKRTVERHLYNIRRKMGCNDNIGVLIKYFEWRQSFLELNKEDAYINAFKASISSDNRLASLSPQQFNHLLAMLKGLTAKQIAAKLALSTRTVEKHFEHIKAKLDCRTNLEVVSKYCNLHSNSC